MPTMLKKTPYHKLTDKEAVVEFSNMQRMCTMKKNTIAIFQVTLHQ